MVMSNHKIDNNLVSFIDFELELYVVVAESHPEFILRAITDYIRSLFKTLASKASDDKHLVLFQNWPIYWN